MRLFVIWLVMSCAIGVDGQIRSTMIDLGTYFTRSVRLTDQSVFRSLKTPSFSHCVKVCVLSKSCHTITFDLRDGLCELADNEADYQVTTGQRYVTTASSTAGAMPPYVASLASECNGNNCEAGSMCIRLASGVPQCVITECSKPGPLANGYSDSAENRSVGAVISYTCNPGYVLDGAANRTCKANGNWTEVMCQPEPFEGAFVDQGLYTDFQEATDTCNGALPLLNPPTVASILTSAVASFKGYCANCPDVLIARQTSSTFYSDNWPESYQSFAGCACLINTYKSNYKMQLDILSLSLESCCDSLWVYDGPDETSPILGKYTGTLTSVEIIVSSANELYLEFRSDASVQQAGFEIRYTEVSSSTSSSLPTSLSPPGALPLYYWVSGQIDESQMVWTYPDGSNVTQTLVMYPNFAYLKNHYNSTGTYYNNVSFTDYRLCFSITSQILFGINPAVIKCHVACHIQTVV